MTNYYAEMVIQNVTDQEISFQVQRGQLLETATPPSFVQNLVVARDYDFRLHAHGEIRIMVECFCANRSFAPPSNTLMRVTHFVSTENLNSQREAWQHFSKDWPNDKE
jgi:hypothetical protein